MIQKLKAILAIPDLRRKLLLTVVLLAVYRMGFWVPLPIVNQEIVQENIAKLQQGEGGPLAELEEKARRLEHLLEVLSRQNGRTATAFDIRTVQGALGWPLRGKVVEQFGKQRNPKFSTVTFNNGLKIAAPAGTEVHGGLG